MQWKSLKLLFLLIDIVLVLLVVFSEDYRPIHHMTLSWPSMCSWVWTESLCWADVRWYVFVCFCTYVNRYVLRLFFPTDIDKKPKPLMREVTMNWLSPYGAFSIKHTRQPVTWRLTIMEGLAIGWPRLESEAYLIGFSDGTSYRIYRKPLLEPPIIRHQ